MTIQHARVPHIDFISVIVAIRPIRMTDLRSTCNNQAADTRSSLQGDDAIDCAREDAFIGGAPRVGAGCAPARGGGGYAIWSESCFSLGLG